MTMSGLPPAMQDLVAADIKRQDRLRELGFTQDEFGQWHAANCRVTLYSVFGDYEIDIHLPNGSAVGCDVPIKALSGRTADEIEADRNPDRESGLRTK